MQAIVYIAHGTRHPDGVKEAKAFVDAHRNEITASIQITSFLDFVEPSPLDAIQMCVNQGATNIAIVPIILLAAGHARRDIPELIVKAKRMYPHISFSCSSVFGVNERIVDVLISRMQEQSEIEKTDRILLVARGSSDQRILDDFAQIRQLLSEKVHVATIDVCYLACQQPTFIDGLRQVIANPSGDIFIVPYLLFTGRLMEHIERKVQEIAIGTKRRMFLCNQLGMHERLSQLFLERSLGALHQTNDEVNVFE